MVNYRLYWVNIVINTHTLYIITQLTCSNPAKGARISTHLEWCSVAMWAIASQRHAEAKSDGGTPMKLWSSGEKYNSYTHAQGIHKEGWRPTNHQVLASYPGLPRLLLLAV